MCTLCSTHTHTQTHTCSSHTTLPHTRHGCCRWCGSGAIFLKPGCKVTGEGSPLQRGPQWQHRQSREAGEERGVEGGSRLTAPLQGEALLMTAYSFMISIVDSGQVCLLHHGSCVITFWPCQGCILTLGGRVRGRKE